MSAPRPTFLLAGEREHLFTLLRVPGVNATNWRAEHAIRPAIVTHKDPGVATDPSWSRHVAGRRSMLRTATHQARDPVELLTRLLQTPGPIVADLAIPGR